MSGLSLWTDGVGLALPSGRPNGTLDAEIAWLTKRRPEAGMAVDIEQCRYELGIHRHRGAATAAAATTIIKDEDAALFSPPPQPPPT